VADPSGSQEPTTVDWIAARLVEAIRKGDIKPGQRLVVADIAQQLKVSAGPVREAMRDLAGAGILEISPHKGARVQIMTTRAVQDIYDIREMLEALAARRAAERIELGANRDRFDRAVAEVRRASKDAPLSEYIAVNRAFHRTVWELASSTRLVGLLDQLTVFIDTLRDESRLDAAHLKASAWEHEALIEAISSGDGRSAERTMRAHIRHYAEIFLEMLHARKAAHQDGGVVRNGRKKGA
jgi:DNA-binding GntR family transcriptional regulator